MVCQLELCLGEDQWVAPSATVQGRQRLGSEPLAQLFGLLTRAWGHHGSSPTCVGLRMLAVDGVVWSTPDTPENRQALGDCANQHGVGAWPQIRAFCLHGHPQP